MFLFDEKRALTDRRVSNDGPPLGSRERRVAHDRRQMNMAEIPFNEWAIELMKYQKRSVTHSNSKYAVNAPKLNIRSHG
jgi:hypothetical protein